jgi:O-antigen ligase
MPWKKPRPSLELGDPMTVFGRFFPHDHRRATLAGRPAYQMGTALVLGGALGLAVLVPSPPLILSGLVGLILLIATFKNPEIVILVVLCLVSDLVPARFNAPIRLPVGTFHVSDLLLIWLLFVVVFRVFTDKTFPYVKTPLDKPVLLFFAAVVVAMGTSMFRFGMRLKEAQIEARVFMYYLVFFAVTNLIRTRLQLVRLVRGILAIGLLVAGMMIAQAMLGQSLLLMDRQILRGRQLMRFFHPGTVVIFTALMMLICDIALRRQHQNRLLRPLSVLVLGGGILLTLARNLLISGLVSLAVLIFILREFPLGRLAGNFLLIACIAFEVVAVAVIGGKESLVLQYPTAFLGRVSHMSSGAIMTSDETLVSRWIEIRYAWAHIVESPIFGIGLYRPYRPPFYVGDNVTRYVHNAYVSIWLKTGLLGLIPFLWICARFLRRGFQNWRSVQDDFLRAVTLGFTLTFLAMMASNLVAPFFVQGWNLAIFGVMLGINELILVHDQAIDRRTGGT